MTLVRQAEFAEMCEVSRKTVTIWREAGKLVLQGKLIDVEATEERMKRIHRGGSPIKNAPSKIVTPALGKVTKLRRDREFVTPEGNKSLMTVGAIEAQLLALDWSQAFDWSPVEIDKRARLAAQAIGWEAVTSTTEDDGHWGDYQVRISAYMANGLHAGAIAGGFGYELDASDVLNLVRQHISVRVDADGLLIQGDDEPIEIHSDLISLLTRPFCETDRHQE